MPFTPDQLGAIAPTVRLHPDESYYPENPKTFIQDSRFRHYRGKIGQSDQGYNKTADTWDSNNDKSEDYFGVPAAKINEYTLFRDEDGVWRNRRPYDSNAGHDWNVFLSLSGEKSARQGNRTPTGQVSTFYYCSPAASDGSMMVTYWFFYPYNDQGNWHEGDWERVRYQLDRSGAIITVAYFAHGDPEWVSWDNVEKASGRAVAYAARGSHASYSAPGSYTTAIPLIFKDECATGGVVWDTAASAADLLDQPWKDFAGGWGDHKDHASDWTGPLGPYPSHRQEELSGFLSRWKMSLPDCGNHITSVTTSGPWVYTASQGHVYRAHSLDGSAPTHHHKPIEQQKNKESRVTVAGDLVVVGANGWAAGFSTDDLGWKWSTSLPDCGNHVTSVAGGSGLIFAASQGHVYRLDAAGSVVEHHSPIPKMKNKETRLVYRSGRIYAGANGWAAGFNETTLHKDWDKSLPGCGNQLTSMATGGGHVYAGSAGHVYRLSHHDGEVLAHYIPDGTPQDHETRLAYGDGTVYAGVNGVVIALDAKTLARKWALTLPASPVTPTSVLYDGERVYAAVSGYLFAISASGTLEGTSVDDDDASYKHEIRMAATGGQLLLASNGWLFNTQPVSGQ